MAAQSGERYADMHDREMARLCGVTVRTVRYYDFRKLTCTGCHDFCVETCVSQKQ